MHLKNIAVLLFLLVTIANAQSKKSTYLNTLSEQFLQQIKNKEDSKEIQQKLATIKLEELVNILQTDTQKLAFWVNIYNAYIQVLLSERPELYKNRSSFFSKDRITIAGYTISFDKIEHGIIRKSQSKIGFGYVKKGFPDKFERILRVAEPDYRIHFALNCGAKDCPPVAIYTPEDLEKQFSNSTSRFLKSSSRFLPKTKEVEVSSLFSWFRGDFGGKDGVRKILYEEGIIPNTDGIDLLYKDYDWTLALHNFIE